MKQKCLGFEIKDSNGCSYPLYLLTEAPLSTRGDQLKQSRQAVEEANRVKLKIKNVILFEQAIILLDQNIQYLLFNFRYKLEKQPVRKD